MAAYPKERSRIFITISVMTLLLFLTPAAELTYAGPHRPKVLILEFHGIKREILEHYLEELPHFRELIKGPQDKQPYVYLSNVYTTIPGGSVPDITSLYTGLYPQETGVVSTIWFDRSEKKIKTMISPSQQRINNILESRGIKTLFDYVRAADLRSLTCMLMVTKGADWSLKSSIFFWGNASVLGFLRKGYWIPDSRYTDQKTMSAFLNGHLISYYKSLAGLLREDGIIPDVMAVEFLGTDLFSHYPSEDLKGRCASMDDVQGFYARKVLDPMIGRLLDFLKEEGCLDDIIFFLVSDHGFSIINRHVPDEAVDRSLREDFRLAEGETGNNEAEAIIMPGAGTKEIYLRNRQSGNWMDPPGLMKDVKPAIDLVLANKDIQDCMETLVVRQYPGERDEGLKEQDQWWVFDWKSYREGPKNTEAFLRALRPLSFLEKILELHEYVIQGLRRQYTRETTPDIKLINKQGFYFERDLRKYGHHGSYYPDDSIVSFWLAGPGLRHIIRETRVINHPCSTLDLVPMVTYLLGVPLPGGLEGDNPLLSVEGISTNFRDQQSGSSPK